MKACTRTDARGHLDMYVYCGYDSNALNSGPFQALGISWALAQNVNRCSFYKWNRSSIDDVAVIYLWARLPVERTKYRAVFLGLPAARRRLRVDSVLALPRGKSVKYPWVKMTSTGRPSGALNLPTFAQKFFISRLFRVELMQPAVAALQLVWHPNGLTDRVVVWEGKLGVIRLPSMRHDGWIECKKVQRRSALLMILLR